MLFKILVLEHLYGLRDERMEDEILESVSFQRFLNINSVDHVPDARTIWVFRNRLDEGNVKALFKKFEAMMKEAGVKYSRGAIVDASFTEPPHANNTKEEKEYIKRTGEAPQEWTEKQKQHKDTEARFARKGGAIYYGYKNHVAVDVKSKLIVGYEATPANVHDSQVNEQLLPEGTRSCIGDSAYGGDPIKEKLKERVIKLYAAPQRHRGQAELSGETKLRNKRISRLRSRVEHVFAVIKQMGGDFTQAVGLAKNAVRIGLTNLVYNMMRFCYLKSSGVLCPQTGN